MLPGPPPPVFSQAPSSPSASESAQPIRAGTFNPTRLPPLIQSNPTGNAARHYARSGRTLAPISIPGTLGGGGTVDGNGRGEGRGGGSGGDGGGSGVGVGDGGRSLQPAQHRSHQPPTLSHLPHSHHHFAGPLAPQSDFSSSSGHSTPKFDQLLSDRPTFASPGFSSPASFNFEQRGSDFRLTRHLSTESSSSPGPRVERQNHSNMISSPTYTVRRSPEQNHHLSPEDPFQHRSSRFTPNSAEGAAGMRRELGQNSNGGGRYRIIVRQQPVAARACGFGERDRRVIDPPPIVQLLVNDPVTGAPDTAEMRYPFNVVHCALWSVDGATDETALIGMDKRVTRRLMGTLVSSPFFGTDENSDDGCFFCFPDLSCRTHGRYRLRFVLMRLVPVGLEPDGYTPIIANCMSDIFQVYTAKEFPGMRPSTPLTKALKKQGCAISVKKGNEKTVGSRVSGEKGGGTDDDAAELSPSQFASRPKRRRRG